MSGEERVRLILIDEVNHARLGNLNNGAGNVFSKWPSYIASVIWCTICAISLVILVIVLIIALDLNERFIRLHKLDQEIMVPKLENEFCKRATNRENRIAGRSFLSLEEPLTQIQDTSQNFFYSLIKPLNIKQACGVESVLRLCPDKLIYLIHFDGFNYRDSSQFETILKRSYSHLNEIRADGHTYVRASPFEGHWKKNAISMFQTNILTIWQFGGTALSPTLIMTDRRLIDIDTPNCLVDRDLIFCPEQCSPYIYELISTLTKELNTQRNGSCTEKVINSSIAEFCGSSDYIRTGCAGVTRIDECLMCTTQAEHCLFIRSDCWAVNDKNWLIKAEKYCPVIMNARLNSYNKKNVS